MASLSNPVPAGQPMADFSVAHDGGGGGFIGRFASHVRLTAESKTLSDVVRHSFMSPGRDMKPRPPSRGI